VANHRVIVGPSRPPLADRLAAAFLPGVYTLLLAAAWLLPATFSPWIRMGLAAGVAVEAISVPALVHLCFHLKDDMLYRLGGAVVLGGLAGYTVLAFWPSWESALALPPLLYTYFGIYKFALTPSGRRSHLLRGYTVLLVRCVFSWLALLLLLLRALFVTSPGPLLPQGPWPPPGCANMMCGLVNEPTPWLAFGTAYYLVMTLATYFWRASWVREIPLMGQPPRRVARPAPRSGSKGSRPDR
jgi:hypothetical protein